MEDKTAGHHKRSSVKVTPHAGHAARDLPSTLHSFHLGEPQLISLGGSGVDVLQRGTRRHRLTQRRRRRADHRQKYLGCG
jgi:hypothetical protein